MHVEDAFLTDAGRILETAAAAGVPGPPWTILVKAEGGLHLVAGSDWSLDSLSLHHGARTAYRVSSRDGRVRVEGRSGSRRCLLDSPSHAETARGLLAPHPAALLALG